MSKHELVGHGDGEIAYGEGEGGELHPECGYGCPPPKPRQQATSHAVLNIALSLVLKFGTHYGFLPVTGVPRTGHPQWSDYFTQKPPVTLVCILVMVLV